MYCRKVSGTYSQRVIQNAKFCMPTKKTKAWVEIKPVNRSRYRKISVAQHASLGNSSIFFRGFIPIFFLSSDKGHKNADHVVKSESWMYELLKTDLDENFPEVEAIKSEQEVPENLFRGNQKTLASLWPRFNGLLNRMLKIFYRCRVPSFRWEKRTEGSWYTSWTRTVSVRGK